MDGTTSQRKAVLEPILRLASAILDTEACFKFWHAIINAKREPDASLSVSHGLLVPTFRPIDIYSIVDSDPAAVREEFQKTILYISLFLKINLFGDTSPPVVYTPSDPTNIPDHRISMWDRKISFRTSHRTKVEGYGMDMKLSISRLLEISRLESLEPRTPHITNRILRLQFSMAVSICHKLTQVVARTTRHRLEMEPFYEDQSVNELGRAFETEVFCWHGVRARAVSFSWAYKMAHGNTPTPSPGPGNNTAPYESLIYLLCYTDVLCLPTGLSSILGRVAKRQK